MKIVVPYVLLHPITAANLADVAPDAERVFVGDGPHRYWQLVCDLWSAGEPFLVVEQDMEIHRTAISQAHSCTCPWGLSPYPVNRGNEVEAALGCTRFSAQLMAWEPDLLWHIGANQNARQWQRLDTQILGELRRRGHAPHVHQPAVAHHHVYEGVCSCGIEHDDYIVDTSGRYAGAVRR